MFSIENEDSRAPLGCSVSSTESVWVAFRLVQVQGSQCRDPGILRMTIIVSLQSLHWSTVAMIILHNKAHKAQWPKTTFIFVYMFVGWFGIGLSRTGLAVRGFTQIGYLLLSSQSLWTNGLAGQCSSHHDAEVQENIQACVTLLTSQ